MTVSYLLECLSELESRVRTLEHENQQLRDENKQLRNENAALKHHISELEAALKNKADAKAAKKPKFSLNYGVERNHPTADKKLKLKYHSKSTGRVPNSQKFDNSGGVVDIFPENISTEHCVIWREQGAWRLIDGNAKYVRYRIHAPANAKTLPKIPGIRNSRSEYGSEIIVSLAFLVYWIGMSIDNAREVLRYFTRLELSKGQADSLLKQLSADWEVEYKNIASRIVKSAILYIDETGWKVGKKSCYTWIFSTVTEVFYRCGVGRGKDVLDETLGGKFSGTGVSDDYAAYDSAFTHHQLCWAHPLRKAVELKLRNPKNAEYHRFCKSLFEEYRLAVRLSKDQRLSVGRAGKAKLLAARLRDICLRRDEVIVTEKMVAEARKRDPQTELRVTSESDTKLIRLQKQLYAKAELMFVFVENPSVEPTNNRSERAARPEALARKSSRTSKTDAGAMRRGIIMTVLATLDKRLKRLTLSGVVEAVEECVRDGIALFLPMPDKPG